MVAIRYRSTGRNPKQGHRFTGDYRRNHDFARVGGLDHRSAKRRRTLSLPCPQGQRLCFGWLDSAPSGRIWFTGFQDIGTFLGLVSAGLAIALKDLVASVAGWMYLLWRRPFEVGDRIQIGEHAGDVIDIRLFRFTLIEIGNWVDADQSTGRVILVPNSRILIEVIANYSKGFQYIWNEIPVLVTFESNWPKAKAILQKIVDDHSAHLSESAMQSVRKAAQRAMIIYSTLTPKVWTSVGDSGVFLTIRYLCDPRKRRGSAEAIWEDILTEFGKCDDIDFAYPTVRRYMNLEEGKSGAKGFVPALPVQQEFK